MSLILFTRVHQNCLFNMFKSHIILPAKCLHTPQKVGSCAPKIINQSSVCRYITMSSLAFQKLFKCVLAAGNATPCFFKPQSLFAVKKNVEQEIEAVIEKHRTSVILRKGCINRTSPETILKGMNLGNKGQVNSNQLQKWRTGCWPEERNTQR